MSFELSSQVKIVALAGVLVALAGAAFLLLQGGHSTPKTATVPVTPTHHRAQAHPAPARHAATPAVQLTAGLPAPLVRALEHSKLVVAVVWAKGDPVAADTLAQAKAGARSVHAPLVVLNVANDAVAARTATWMNSDIVQPAVLVVRRPGTVAVELAGYADKTSVAQAVVDSRR
jgi:hypothetical protein